MSSLCDHVPQPSHVYWYTYEDDTLTEYVALKVQVNRCQVIEHGRIRNLVNSARGRFFHSGDLAFIHRSEFLEYRYREIEQQRQTITDKMNAYSSYLDMVQKAP